MNHRISRTLQAGAALLILTVASLAVLVVLDVLDVERAMRIGIEVSAVIGVALLAGLALVGLFSLGSGDGGESRDP